MSGCCIWSVPFPLIPALSLGERENPRRWVDEPNDVGTFESQPPLPEKPILLSFDDAYEELPARALPILEKYGFKATVFVVTSQINGTNSWDEAAGWGRKRLMSAEDILAWSKRGIEFQCHSHTHADLTGLPESGIMRELTTSRAQLEALVRQPMTAFAYPYGSHNPLAKDCVGRVFALGLSCEPGRSDLLSDPHLLPRVNMLPQFGWLSPFFEVHLGYNPLLRLRTQLGRWYRALARRAPACCAGMVAAFERLARKLGHAPNGPLPKT